MSCTIVCEAREHLQDYPGVRIASIVPSDRSDIIVTGATDPTGVRMDILNLISLAVPRGWVIVCPRWLTIDPAWLAALPTTVEGVFTSAASADLTAAVRGPVSPDTAGRLWTTAFSHDFLAQVGGFPRFSRTLEVAALTTLMAADHDQLNTWRPSVPSRGGKVDRDQCRMACAGVQDDLRVAQASMTFDLKNSESGGWRGSLSARRGLGLTVHRVSRRGATVTTTPYTLAE